MLFEAHHEIKVAGLPAFSHRFALAGQADFLPFAHPFRNAHFVRLDLRFSITAKGNLFLRTVQRLFDRYQQIGFDVAPPVAARAAESWKTLVSAVRSAAAEELL